MKKERDDSNATLRITRTRLLEKAQPASASIGPHMTKRAASVDLEEDSPKRTKVNDGVDEHEENNINVDDDDDDDDAEAEETDDGSIGNVNDSTNGSTAFNTLANLGNGTTTITFPTNNPPGLAALTDPNTAFITIDNVNKDVRTALQTELDGLTDGRNGENWLQNLRKLQKSKALLHCLYKRFHASGDQFWTIEDERKYACYACTNGQRPCCIYDKALDMIIVLSLVPQMRLPGALPSDKGHFIRDNRMKCRPMRHLWRAAEK